MQLGMTVNVFFAPATDGQLVLPPALAGDPQPAVWVVDPATAKRSKPVTVGQFREDMSRSSARAGDVVVTAGVHKLRAGQPVRIADSHGTPTTLQARN